MATIRKRDDKYQVQIRRIGQAPVTRSFEQRKDAHLWARQMEIRADRHDLPPDQKPLERTLGDLVERYRDTVTPRKKGREIETIVLNAFLRHEISRKTMRELRTSDFAVYRDQRLREIKSHDIWRGLLAVSFGCRRTAIDPVCSTI